MNQYTNKQKRIRAVALIMALVMVVTGIPLVPGTQGTAEAATGNIQPYYPNGQGQQQENPLMVHSKLFTLNGTYRAIADPQSIRYKVEQVDTGQSYASSASPVIEENNGFRFVDVDLFVGLNKITIEHQAGSMWSIVPFYVFYNDSPMVANLRMDRNIPIDSDENIITVTLSGNQTVAQVNMTGIAYNTNELIIRNKTLLGAETNAEQSVQINNFTNDFFTIVPLKPGVNELELIAKNSQGRVHTLTRKVVLNVITGLGLSVMNMQSTYISATAIDGTNLYRNHLPEGGKIDISQPGGASNQTNLNLITAMPGDGNILFSGRILLNGINMQEFDKVGSYPDPTDPANSLDAINQLEFVIQDNRGSVPVDVPGSSANLYAALTQKINGSITAASLTNTQDGVAYVDFAVVIPEASFGGPSAWNHGKYTIVLKPKIYRNNPQNSTDYALATEFAYSFEFANHNLPQFSGVSVVANGEYIMEHNQPYGVSQESLELYLHHRKITSNNIKIRVYQAPYDIPANVDAIDESKGISVTAEEVRGDGERSLVKIRNLPSGNILVVAYVGDKGGDPKTQAMIVKRFLVAKGPAVTLKAGDGSYVTYNKEYVYDEKSMMAQTPPFTDGAFLAKYFQNMKIEVSSYSNPNLGDSANPITVEVNGEPVTIAFAPPSVPPGEPPIEGKLEGTLNLHTGANKVLDDQLNRVVVSFKDGSITSRTEFSFYVIMDGAPVIKAFKTHFEGDIDPVEHRFGDIVETDKDFVSIEGGAENFDEVTLFINGEIVATVKKDANGDLIPRQNYQTSYKYQLTWPSTVTSILEFEVRNLALDNQQNEGLIDQFHISLEVKKGTTVMSEKIIIMPKRDIFTVLAPFRQVVNNNLQPIIIKAPTASSVKIGKVEAQKISTKDEDTNHMSAYVMNYLRDRLYGENKINEEKLGAYVFYAEVPLKTGENKLKLTVTVGNDSYPGELVLFYAGTLAEGAVYQTDLRKNKISPKELGGAVSLSFPKNTLLQPRSSIMEGHTIPYELPDFWYDKSVLIGVANKYTGKVDRDISRSNLPLRNMLVGGSPNALDYYHYASELFYIDAGTLESPGGRLPFEGNMVTSRRERDVLVTNTRGTLTLKYNADVVQDASIHMTVMYHPGYAIDGQTQWRNIGGVVNAKNNTITVPFDGFGYYVVMKLSRSFNDVINHGWARRNIEAVFSKGIMANETPERFGPDRPITRGEFATILVKALEIEINDGPYDSDQFIKSPTRPTFDDVRPNMGLPFWDYKYIETAARAGIVQGKFPRRFVPNEFLTREQAAVMIARALEAKLARTPEQALTQLTKEFTDAPSIEYYALQSVAAISKTGIVVGKQNDPNDVSKGYSFLPKNTLTRAEASVIATRLMQYKKLLPDPL